MWRIISAKWLVAPRSPVGRHIGYWRFKNTDTERTTRIIDVIVTVDATDSRSIRRPSLQYQAAVSALSATPVGADTSSLFQTHPYHLDHDRP